MNAPQFYETLCSHTGAKNAGELAYKLTAKGFKTSNQCLLNWQTGRRSPSLTNAARACEAVGLQITITTKPTNDANA